MKMVEVKRFTADVAQEVVKQLQEYQRQLEGSLKMVAEMKSAAAEAKEATMKSAAEEKVYESEELVNKVASLFGVFSDDVVAELSSEELRSRGAECKDAEAAAIKALKEAQELVT